MLLPLGSIKSATPDHYRFLCLGRIGLALLRLAWRCLACLSFLMLFCFVLPCCDVIGIAWLWLAFLCSTLLGLAPFCLAYLCFTARCCLCFAWRHFDCFALFGEARRDPALLAFACLCFAWLCIARLCLALLGAALRHSAWLGFACICIAMLTLAWLCSNLLCVALLGSALTC